MEKNNCLNCLRCNFRHKDNGNCTAVGGFCTAVPAAHCPLLRQYLDTGLTPQDVISMHGEWRAMMSVLNSIGGGYTRLRELAEADKDGRVVVLPNKPSSTITNADRIRNATNQQLAKQIYDSQKELCRMLYKNLGFEDELNFSEDYSDILAWLNAPAKEAEKALEAMK